MEEVKKIWKDGKVINWHDCTTHVLTHTLHYGGGVFEGVRFYETEKGPAVFRLKEHIARLLYSAGVIEMKVPFSEDDLIEAVKQTIKVNKINAGYIRPLAYYGYGKMGLNPIGADINVIIALWPWGSYLGDKPIKVKVSKYIRIHPKSTVPDAKICGHYVNSILASQEISRSGYDEALFLDYRGKVAEGPGENIFYVKDGKIFTPKVGSILPGITRDSVMQIVRRELGLKVKEKTVTLQDLKNADEVFFTGTAAEVTPIAQIEDHLIGNGAIGPISKEIKRLFIDIIYGRNEKFYDWLTFV